MDDGSRVVETGRCESCGAGREAPAPGAGTDDDAITHCEWCGAEYPAPASRSDDDSDEGAPGA